MCAPSSPARSIASLRQAQRLRARRVVGRREAALREARVEMEAARDAVDAVAVERLLHLLEVVGRELLRVVELVVVHQVAEPLDCRPHLLRGARTCEVGLVAAGIEPRRHRRRMPRCPGSSSCLAPLVGRSLTDHLLRRAPVGRDTVQAHALPGRCAVIAFMTANYVARETGWDMHGWATATGRRTSTSRRSRRTRSGSTSARRDPLARLRRRRSLGRAPGARLGDAMITSRSPCRCSRGTGSPSRRTRRGSARRTWRARASSRSRSDVDVIGGGMSGERSGAGAGAARARCPARDREPPRAHARRGAARRSRRATARSARPSTPAGGPRRATTRPARSRSSRRTSCTST